MWTPADRETYRETRTRYPSDLSDEEWKLTAPFFADHRPVSASVREIVQACLYLVAEGCRWRALPKDFPPWQTVRWWWDRFRREGTWARATRALTPPARVAAGRDAAPRTGLVDTRSVRCGPQKGDAASTAARS
jgi:putative transposase